MEENNPDTENETIQHIPSTVTVANHTMGISLYNYLAMKVHPDVTSRAWTRILIRGQHSRCAPSRIMAIEKTDKPFNWQRPTSVIHGDTLEIQCFPGKDYVQHMASIIATHLSLHGQDASVVRYTLPSGDEQTMRPLLSSNLRELGPVDIAILGSVQGLSEFVGPDWDAGSANSNSTDQNIFAWQKQTLPNGSRVAFVGCRVSFWGDIAANVVRALHLLSGVQCVLYLGKLGSLHADHIPNTLLATGNTSLVDGELVEWENVLQTALDAEGYPREAEPPLRGQRVVRYGNHYTLSSVLQETHDWLERHRRAFHWVDPEIGHMARAALSEGVGFGYLHVVSDNLARKYTHDLSNEREVQVLSDRLRVLGVVQRVLSRFLEGRGV